MRVLFCGSGYFALPSLRAILESEHELVGVVTQPPRTAGRGGKLRPTLIAEQGQSSGLEVVEQSDINSSDAIEDIRRRRPDVICVVDFGQFIRSAVCQTAPKGTFNLHGSLLPKLRGAAPVNGAIIQGYEQTGVTTFSIVPAMDAGPIYDQKTTDIRPEETAEELRARLAELGAALVCETLDMLAADSAKPRPQNDAEATLAPRLTKHDGRLDFSLAADAIRNRIHGTWPWPGGQALLQRQAGKAVSVLIARAAVVDQSSDLAPGTFTPELLVATGDKLLEVQQIKPAGRKLIEFKDLVNGYRLQAGDRFVEVGL